MKLILIILASLMAVSAFASPNNTYTCDKGPEGTTSIRRFTVNVTDNALVIYPESWSSADRSPASFTHIPAEEAPKGLRDSFRIKNYGEFFADKNPESVVRAQTKGRTEKAKYAAASQNILNGAKTGNITLWIQEDTKDRADASQWPVGYFCKEKPAKK